MSAASAKPPANAPSRGASAEPDDLLRDFRGGGLVRFALLALVVHTIVILAASVPWLRTTFLGDASAGLTEQQKLDAAVEEAAASIQAIAKEHGVPPQDLSARFVGGAKPAAAKPAPAAAASGDPAPAPAAAGGPPPTVSTPSAGQPQPPPDAAPPVPAGPAMPDVDANVDLFK